MHKRAISLDSEQKGMQGLHLQPSHTIPNNKNTTDSHAQNFLSTFFSTVNNWITTSNCNNEGLIKLKLRPLKNGS